MSTSRKITSLGLFVVLGMSLGFIGGCHSDDGLNENPSAPKNAQEVKQNVQNQIEAIKKNPKMTEQQKATAIAAYQSSQAMTKN